MQMAGMSMPAQGGWGAYVAYVARWVGMMAAMMLPSLLPRLRSYRRAVRDAGPMRAGLLLAMVGAGYLAVWTAIGGLIYPARAAVAAVAAAAPAFEAWMPALAGAVVVAAGLLQFTAWKARHLACWRAPVGRADSDRYTVGQALRFGGRLGLHCSACGAGLSAAMLVLGVMDPRAMMLAAAAVTLERGAPVGQRVARALGAAGIVVGTLIVIRASGMV